MSNRHRIERMSAPSVRSWGPPEGPGTENIEENVLLEMGWGRLMFGQTFRSIEHLVEMIKREAPGQRDIIFYLRDPHVALSLAPQELFLDPSHTYRLWSHKYVPASEPPNCTIRRLQDESDVARMNQIYASQRMAVCNVQTVLEQRAGRTITRFMAETIPGSSVDATVTGVDHVEAFNDPEGGASLWGLAVDPQASVPGLGEAMVRHLVEHYFARGRNYVDLSVMHDNSEAVRLYEKLGFERVPVFCLKRKNPINEPLFTSPEAESDLNPYARIITDEARRRGIGIDVVDAQLGYFALTFGGRTVHCRESLSELTTAVAFCRCDDKRMTHRLLAAAELRVPAQRAAGSNEDNAELLRELGSVVVKPARGEQGDGVSVDIRTPDALAAAVERARRVCRDVIIEELMKGDDLRVIVIDGEVVAAALRRPPEIVGTGDRSIEQLVNRYSRRRRAATGGESSIPIDEETIRCIADAGYRLDQVLPTGETLVVRRTANLHTGGTIHDVTEEIHPALARASQVAAETLDIPVVGLDLIVPDHREADYVIIEANERPGLANHEPQPTAQRFIDLLFPQTRARGGAEGGVR
jgi:GNAT-family acetyltransferase (TIGR03103 family)